MTDLAEMTEDLDIAPMGPPRDPAPLAGTLNRPEKAAIILGVLGAEGAGPLLEQLDEGALRTFAGAMARLERIPPEAVAATISEFLAEIEAMDLSVSGGLSRARDMLQDYVNEATLARIMDDAESPSIHNVWQKLSKVDDTALTEFLCREHPQTAAVVLSKLPAEHSARIIGLMESGRACEIVMGLTRAAGLEANVVEAIGRSVSRDFLANQRDAGENYRPADRIGAIMNFTPGNTRQTVLDFLDKEDAELADLVKRKMFTFQDIPDRIEKRDIPTIVRAVDGEVFLKAMSGAAETAPETREYMLSSISSRVAEQVRADIAELGKVKVREAEEAQTAILKVIRDLQDTGDLKLIEQED